MAAKFDSQVDLEELTQIKLMKHVLVTSSCQDHVTWKRCYNFLLARSVIIKLS